VLLGLLGRSGVTLQQQLSNKPTSNSMSWLANLPHQIPFRAASAVRWIDEKTVEGIYLCTANDLAPAGVMAVEAMAQFAGGLVLKERGFLTGIDRCEVLREIAPGDAMTCVVTLEAEFGGTFRFSGVGTIEGAEAVKGRFYLAGNRIED
jgi:3-hydroxymyristoyl/3-hydroxydecanoyl-(acyl carrier protein) dehydratase